MRTSVRTSLVSWCTGVCTDGHLATLQTTSSQPLTSPRRRSLFTICQPEPSHCASPVPDSNSLLPLLV